MTTLNIFTGNYIQEIDMLVSPDLDTLLLVGQYPICYRAANTLDRIKKFKLIEELRVWDKVYPELLHLNNQDDVNFAINVIAIPTQLTFVVEVNLDSHPNLDGQLCFKINSSEIRLEEMGTILPTTDSSFAKLINVLLSSFNQQDVPNRKVVYGEILKLIYNS